MQKNQKHVHEYKVVDDIYACMWELTIIGNICSQDIIARTELLQSNSGQSFGFTDGKAKPRFHYPLPKQNNQQQKNIY